MRPEGASILSARCEIREIPLTVTSKTDSTLYSTSKTRRAGPSAHCGTRLTSGQLLTRHSSTGVRGFPLTALYTCDRAARVAEPRRRGGAGLAATGAGGAGDSV